jgi:predicted ATP-grasp superfamily ATP-dependent carboligase
LRILVTDGDSRAALAVTRSLGRLGQTILVGEKRKWAIAQASRFCARAIQYPDPGSEEAAFIEALVRIVREHQVDVILPVRDVSAILVTQHRALFEPACHVPFADNERLQKAADKTYVLRAAERLGVPIPRTTFLSSAHEVDGYLDRLSFPVVIKGKASKLRTNNGWISSGVKYASHPGELRADVSARHEAEFPLLLQERIHGPGMGVFACYDRGAPVAFFSHRRIREKPPTGGVSVLSESVPMCPAARRYAEALLNDLRWHGVAMVEFKVDERDGGPRLMEINGRFWGSLQLAVDAGVDFPAILLDTVRSSNGAAWPEYRIGVKSRWFLGDLDSLLIQLFGKAPGPEAPTSKTERLRPLLEFMKLWERDLYYENPRLSDLGPGFCEFARWIRGSASWANG